MQIDDLTGQLGDWLFRHVPLANRAPILIAVSGGSDSVGLLHAAARLPHYRFSAATIDHGLRVEAAEEAAFVGNLCAGLKVPHEVRKLDWPDGERPSQSRARRHRYALLSACARQAGAQLVLTAHTAEDQNETCLMRLEAGSDEWGCAGMQMLAPLPVWPEGSGLQLGRPFLNAHRAQIRQVLVAENIPWRDDPSNENPAYERVRARQRLAGDPDLANRIHRLRQDTSEARNVGVRQLRSFLDEQCVWYPGGSLSVPRARFDDLEPSLQLRFLQHVLPCVSGKTTGPRADERDALHQAMVQDSHVSKTLGGCQIRGDGDCCLITPELTPAPVLALSGDGFVWQGRVQVTASVRLPKLDFWGDRGIPERLDSARELPFQVRRSLPVILDEAGSVTGVPHLEQIAGICVSDLAESRLKKWLSEDATFFSADFDA